ncbi:MAG: hypothetical protein ACREIR_05585 [Geminicoccaceae bacterium]
MPDPISQAARTPAGSAATALEGAVWDALGLRDAVEGARLEAERSGLPGVDDGGPGDAYRHLLITGEMKRRFGPTFAELFADGHEFVNDLTSSQTELDGKMDNANNGVAADAPEFETWQEVVEWARGEVVEAAAHDGDGQDGRAFWYNKQPANWRPDFTDVPITPIEKGGPEHRYDADEGDAVPDEPSPRASISADPLDRPVASWTEDDVRAVLSSPAYLRPQHARRGEAERKVRAWFGRRFGTGPVPVDATGRAIRDAPARAGRAGACAVAVQAHSRGGGKVVVGAHCRSMPAI